MRARILTQTLLEVAEKHDQTLSTCSTPRTKLRLKLPTPKLGPMRSDSAYASLANRSRLKSANGGSHARVGVGVGDQQTGSCEMQTDESADNGCINGSNDMQACDITESWQLASHDHYHDSACASSSNLASSTCNGVRVKSAQNHNDASANGSDDAEGHGQIGGMLASISSLEALCNVIVKVCVRAYRIVLCWCTHSAY
jgi:hypothetical protein